MHVYRVGQPVQTACAPRVLSELAACKTLASVERRGRSGALKQ